METHTRRRAHTYTHTNTQNLIANLHGVTISPQYNVVQTFQLGLTILLTASAQKRTDFMSNPRHQLFVDGVTTRSLASRSITRYAYAYVRTQQQLAGHFSLLRDPEG